MELKKVVYENGIYRWSCESDEEFTHFEYRCGIRTGLIVALLGLLFGIFLLKDEKRIIAIITSGITILIALAVGSYILKKSKTETIPYELREDCIKFREGRGTTFVNFKRVLYTDTRANRIMLHTRFSHIPVYIPQEDFGPISELIAKRIKEQSKAI
jgi:hypothetical protein